MRALIAVLAVSCVAFGATANLSDEVSEASAVFGVDGVVHTYPTITSPMGLDYDVNNDWLWQTSENSGQTITVDPSTGVYTSRFYITSLPGLSTSGGNGVYYDPATDYLYIADFNGDGGIQWNDAIYCLDVSTPGSPTVVDTWDLGSLNGILGVTYKSPYFYCTYHNGSMKYFTLNPGGTYVDEGTFSQSAKGDIWYDAVWNVFYTHTSLGFTVYVLDGDDPNTTLDTYNPGCNLDDGICPDPGYPALMWTSSFQTTSNYVFDQEYLPPALERSTWGDIKTLF